MLVEGEPAQMISMAREVEMRALQLRQAIDLLLLAHEEWFMVKTRERLARLAGDAGRISELLHDVPVNALATVRSAKGSAEA